MSTIKTDLLTDLSGTYPAQDPGDFDFEFSVAGSPITLGSDYTAITGDQIEVTITNPLFTSCEETITIDFVVNELPSFDIDDPTVICLNLTVNLLKSELLTGMEQQTPLFTLTLGR